MSTLGIVLIGVGSGAYGGVGALIAHHLGEPDKANLAPFGQVIAAMLWPLTLMMVGLMEVFG